MAVFAGIMLDTDWYIWNLPIISFYRSRKTKGVSTAGITGK